MSAEALRRSGGRPTAQAAVQLEANILNAATAAFLRDGYAVTTIEATARACGVAKRTIYARWSGKPALFRAVLERLMTKWLSATGNWSDADGLHAALSTAADQILAVALTPDAVALHRLVIAESSRFPELPQMLQQAGANAGAERLTSLLDQAVARGELPTQDITYAAEQFLHLLLSGPQKRALGLGQPLNPQQLAVWRDRAVQLFLRGIQP